MHFPTRSFHFLTRALYCFLTRSVPLARLALPLSDSRLFPFRLALIRSDSRRSPSKGGLFICLGLESLILMLLRVSGFGLSAIWGDGVNCGCGMLMT